MIWFLFLKKKRHHAVEQAKVRLKEASDVCTTADCIASAASLLEAMDPAADPCQDFYQVPFFSYCSWHHHINGALEAVL